MARIDPAVVEQGKVLMEVASPTLKRLYEQMTHEQVLQTPEWKRYTAIMGAHRSLGRPMTDAELQRTIGYLRRLGE